MTFEVDNCIIQKSREGEVTEARAEEAAKRYRKIRESLDDDLAAGNFFLAEQKQKLLRDQWTKLNDIRKKHEAVRRIDRFQDQGPGRIAKSFFEFLSGQQIGEKSVHREFEGVRHNAHALMADVIERFKPRAAGLRNPAKTQEGQLLERDIVRELFGEDTGIKEAQDAAKAINESLEYLRKEFNRAGGNIPKREDFGLPQQHDPQKVREVGKNTWVERVLPMLDREKMVNNETGMEFTEDELREVLSDTYDTIVSRGLDDLDPTNPKFGQKITTRHQHQRFLQFRDADTWLEYQKQFGPGGKQGEGGKVLFTMARHIDLMSRDIGTMRVLGPNPQSTVQLIGDTLKARFDGSDQMPLMQNLLAETTGKVNTPVNEKVAGFGIAVRNTLQSAILGQAFFSALTDVGFSQTAAKFAGLPQMRLMQRHMGLFTTDNVGRRMAKRLGLGAMGAVEQAQAAARVSGEALGDPGTWAGKTRQLNDAVMRASLLQPWTESAQWAFGMEMLATLTEQSDIGRTFNDLPDALRNTFERNGLGEKEWNAISRSRRFKDPETGADFIRPIEIMETDKDAADKLQQMISTETEFAVPSSFKTARNFLNFGQRAGTFAGEAVRTTAMLKNFPVTVMMLQTGRIAAQQGGLNKAKYTAGLLTATGTMGVLAEQLASIADGKEPRPMDPTSAEGRQTMIDGLWRAGTFGLMGDFVFTNFDKYGTSLGESLAGPALSTLGEGQGLVFGNAIQALSQERDPGETVLEQTNFGRDAVQFAKGVTPGNTLWWSKLAMERLWWDQLQKAADPEYANSFRRTQQIAEQQGTEFFFKPGETLPEGVE